MIVRRGVFVTAALLAAHSLYAAPPQCKTAAVEVEVHAGETMRRPITSTLEFVLQATASGWIVHLEPATGPDRNAELDFAGLATPPYRSVNPLALTTDFSFRAQDAIAWNPRHFAWFTDVRSYAAAMAEYRRMVAGDHSAEARLAGIVAKLPTGELSILDARIVPGTADQAGSAANLATHLEATAHTTDDSAAGPPSALGHLEWVKLRLELAVPPGITVARSAVTGSAACPMAEIGSSARP